MIHVSQTVVVIAVFFLSGRDLELSVIEHIGVLFNNAKNRKKYFQQSALSQVWFSVPHPLFLDTDKYLIMNF